MRKENDVMPCKMFFRHVSKIINYDTGRHIILRFVKLVREKKMF